MNTYEQKQEARRERLLNAAERAEERANTAFKKADLSEEATGIPFGQPIIIGSTGEARHRATIKRAGQAMDRCVAESQRADELRAKAASVGTGGISSDDPDAINKLKAKLADLEQSQSNMKAANRVIRKWSKKGVTANSECEGFNAFASELGAVSDHFSPAIAREVLKPQWGNSGPVGFAPYQLTNNNAKIKATKARIQQLERAKQRQTRVMEFQGVCKLVQNVEENRVQFFFDGKPSADVRGIMKSHGFRWAPSQGAWQRQLTNNAIYNARRALVALGVEL